MADFESLIDSAIGEDRNKLVDELKKAYDESLNIVEDRFKAVLADYSSRIESYYRSSQERLNGEKARLEIELKRAVSGEKEQWLERVYDEAKRRLAEFTKTNEYEDVLKGLIEKYVVDGSVVYCSPSDEAKVKKLVKGKKVEVKTDDKLTGGIKVYYADKGLLRDFTLELVLNQVFEDLKGQIASVLFGEKA